jgi:hypothetical protein
VGDCRTLAVEDAGRALKRAVPGFDRYFANHSIEIIAARDWYLQDGTFDLNRVIDGWNEKLARIGQRLRRRKGYRGYCLARKEGLAGLL